MVDSINSSGGAGNIPPQKNSGTSRAAKGASETRESSSDAVDEVSVSDAALEKGALQNAADVRELLEKDHSETLSGNGQLLDQFL